MSKVLLVDDDELFASEVRNFLTAQNYSVEMCHSGEDALQLLTAFKFDLIILDQNMPELTGSRVCKRYRDRGRTYTDNFSQWRHVDVYESGWI